MVVIMLTQWAFALVARAFPFVCAVLSFASHLLALELPAKTGAN